MTDRITGDVWKTATVALSAFLSGLVIAGVPYVIDAPSSDEVNDIDATQVAMLQRLATLDAQQEQIMEVLRDLETKIDVLEGLVRDSFSGNPVPP